ncbi:MAG: class A beta-lactamase-related serine hydrolase [Acidobacteria bacterium]|nr:MAG: class A beta-lactamase-related serine hydrolase [Acidobacteriota bacterium]REK01652.1 MAG: class A beta-lactamase-related serine hydrolase [Acidobacteriota bacterium]REK14608.1 MAG: class A beta-lactamase-related serine hydrolase [Acidobacteriota bacterium]REK45323.1 MAG: class A beta-lactamase-related serine hydrolase [Acidobacteriota bacterium]
MKLLILTVTFLIAASLFPVLGQTINSPEERARDLVRIINLGERAAFADYVKSSFDGDFRDLPMEQHLGFYSSVYDSTRGFEVVRVLAQEGDRITLLVKSNLTGEPTSLLVRILPDAPYKIVGLGTAPAPADPDAPKLLEAEIAANLGAFLKKLADADVFSGTVILAKDGRPVYKGAFGIANKDFDAPNRIDTKFNLGSMNKMFTGISIAKLVQDGKVSLDDPLSKFLPDFPDAESAKKIKVKHLLTHTAGLGGYFSQRWAEKARGSTRTVDDMIALAKPDESLRFEPGTDWRYSNTGMLVLGKIVEVASGKSYFDFVRENVLTPAGMENTGCFELDKVNKNLAVGYQKEYSDDGVAFRNNIFTHVMRGGPQGGCYSTAEDLLKFSVALQAGKIVSKELAEEFTTAKPDLSSPSYGFGFQADPAGNRFGHGGGFMGISANMDVFPKSGWTAIVLSNYGGGANPALNKMRSIIAAQNVD